ncbi:MAG: tRNA (guanosine(37)-N1)-methyltransferase TrmD [Candidatus Paceibacterota bacterium]
MRFHIITLFPEMFDSYLGESILGRAIKQKKISVSFINPRKFVSGKYKKVWPDGNVSRQIDERPYGGGPGMVMMAEPVLRAVEATLRKIKNYELRIKNGKAKTKNQRRVSKDTTRHDSAESKIIIINFVPSTEKFTTEIAKKISKKYTDVILICGRYEGIDARVDKILKTTKYSVGDYVLTGGEIPAMILIDSLSRQIEGVLGNFDSREEERVSSSEIYTRPEVIIHKNKKYKVPKVLLSGDHKKIEEWKRK